MPLMATSCCILKASLCRNRSCFLLNPVCPTTGLVVKGWRLCNSLLIARESDVHQRVFHTLYPGLPISFVYVTKETGERKVRRSVAARLFSLRFSHRFQRIAKAQLIWYLPSADDFVIFAFIHFLLSALRTFVIPVIIHFEISLYLLSAALSMRVIFSAAWVLFWIWLFRKHYS